MYLRALEPEDLDLLYTIENDEEIWAVGTTSIPYSRQLLRDYIATQRADIHTDGQLRLIACEKPDDRAIGIVDLFDYDAHDQRAEVGIVLLQSLRGQGKGPEMLRLLEQAARRLHIRQLCAYVSASPEAAARQLFAAAGYQRCAVLPQWHFRGDGYEDVELYIKFV